jgi:ATP-binding cassette subfamily B protein
MVCDRLKVPYRPDTLRRWLRKQSLDSFDPIDLYTRIGQAIGFNAQVVQFTATTGGLNRLQTPVLIQCRDVLTVLHDISPEVAVLGSPRTGLLRIAPRRLVKQLVPDRTVSEAGQVMCRAIALERFERSPNKRFGFHWFVPVLVTQWGILLQVLLASMLIQILTVANPLLVQQIIDNVIINANAGAMTMFGVLMLLFALLEGGLTILRRYLLASTTNRIDLHLGIEIVRHLLRLPLPFFERYAVGELSVRLSELENIRQFLTDSAITVVLDVLFSAIYIAVMMLYSVPLTLCVLITIPIVVISTLLMSNVQEKLIRVRADHGAKVQSYLVEVLSGISAVKAQHIESLVEATWRERYVQYLSTGFVANTIGTAFFSYSNFLNTGSSLLVLWVGANQVLEGQMTLGGLIAFRILTGYVTGPLLRLASLWQRFQETALSMNLLADIADAPAEESDHEKSRPELPPIEGHVQYQSVSFGFQPGQLQLEKIDLEIAPKTFVGIVGQSGSGKSTLMKLLPRLYSPQLGTILIDGQDVNRVSLSSLRSQIGIVSQDAVLFQGTIRDNISLFSDLPEETVIEAAKVAEAHEFILQFPNGYDTLVAEKGGTLSGGQRQRIAIARVVARDPRLLIFDEATSALDYETERRVCQNLMQRFGDRTCFFITHRLNTVTGADWILFMQNGIIAEQGTHADLMARRQLYYCLCSQQFQNP